MCVHGNVGAEIEIDSGSTPDSPLLTPMLQHF